MKKIAVALGFKGTLYNDILKAWNILEKDMGINYMSKYHSLPHITTIAGKTKDIEKIYKALNKIRIKKFITAIHNFIRNNIYFKFDF